MKIESAFNAPSAAGTGTQIKETDIPSRALRLAAKATLRCTKTSASDQIHKRAPLRPRPRSALGRPTALPASLFPPKFSSLVAAADLPSSASHRFSKIYKKNLRTFKCIPNQSLPSTICVFLASSNASTTIGSFRPAATFLIDRGSCKQVIN